VPMRPRTLPAHDMNNGKPFLRKLNLRFAPEHLAVEIRRVMLLMLLILEVTLAAPAMAQSASLADSGGPSNNAVLPASPTYPPVDLTYTRPTEKAKLENYFFDAYGPYPIIGAGFAAGLNQAYNNPPEWGQGAQGYGKRFGSNLAIAAVATTTRYGLAEAFREDTIYYNCECKGLMPRLKHALISTLVARRGSDGHSVFSVPALVAPYAGTMTAVYGWYPSRFDYKDGFRMGNYALLGYAAGNIGLEFLYGGPHSLLSRMHLKGLHAAPTPGPNP